MAKRTVAGTPADPTIKFAKLTIDDVEYSLAYSFNAVALAEHVAQCNLLSGLENLANLSALQLRGLLYAALSVAKPDITIEKAGQLIRLDTMGPITQALAEAYSLSMPPAKSADPPVAEAPAES